MAAAGGLEPEVQAQSRCWFVCEGACCASAWKPERGSKTACPKTASARTVPGHNEPMTLDPDAAYLVLAARDARYDGRLFVGVTSTGVYCRPICRVRTPMRRNCRFFDTPAQAEAAAFRPCLKCRPEIAPGSGLPWTVMDASRTLARQAAQALDAQSASGDAPRPGRTGRQARRERSAPAAHLRHRARRDTDAVPADASAADGQAVADRHRAADDAGGAGQRLRQPADASMRRLPAPTA